MIPMVILKRTHIPHIVNNIINEKGVSEEDYTKLRIASLTQDAQRHELLERQEE